MTVLRTDVSVSRLTNCKIYIRAQGGSGLIARIMRGGESKPRKTRLRCPARGKQGGG